MSFHEHWNIFHWQVGEKNIGFFFLTALPMNKLHWPLGNVKLYAWDFLLRILIKPTLKNFKKLPKPLYSNCSKLVERIGVNMLESFSTRHLNMTATIDIFCIHKIFYKKKKNLNILFVFRLIRLQVH